MCARAQLQLKLSGMNEALTLATKHTHQAENRAVSAEEAAASFESQFAAMASMLSDASLDEKSIGKNFKHKGGHDGNMRSDDNLEGRLRLVFDELASRAAQQAELETELATAREDLSAEAAARRDAEEKLPTMGAEPVAVEAPRDRDELKVEWMALSERAVELEMEVARSKQETERLTCALEEALAGRVCLEHEIASMREQLEAENAELAAAREVLTRVHTVEAERDAAVMLAEMRGAELAALQPRLEAAETARDVAEAQMDSLTVRLKLMVQTTEALKRDLGDATSSLEKALSGTDAERAYARAEQRKLEKQHAERLEAQVNTMTETIGILTVKLGELRDKLVGEVAKRQVAVAELEAKLVSETEAREKQLTAHKSAAEERLRELETKHEVRLAKEKDVAKAELMRSELRWRADTLRQVAAGEAETRRVHNAWQVEVEQGKDIVLRAFRANKESNARWLQAAWQKNELGLLVGVLADRYLGLAYAIERGDTELQAAHASLASARQRLVEVEDSSREEVEKLHDHARSERTALVSTALSSLQHLRSHLTVALTNTACANDPDDDRIEYSPIKGRWGLVSAGRFDHVVVKLEAPVPPWPPPSSPVAGHHASHSPKRSCDTASRRIVHGHPARTAFVYGDMSPSPRGDVHPASTPPVRSLVAGSSPTITKPVESPREVPDALPPLAKLPDPMIAPPRNVVTPPSIALEPLAPSPPVRVLSSRLLKGKRTPVLHGSALSQAAVSTRGVRADAHFDDFDIRVLVPPLPLTARLRKRSSSR